MVTFELDPTFVAGYRDRPIPWGPVGYITYKRTYARDGEEWVDTVARVVEGTYSWQKRHCAKYNLPWDEQKAQRSAREFFERMFTFKFLPPGRGLWMMGTKYVEKHGGAALNNCAFISTESLANDFSGSLTFLMDMSMLGVGVGFDTLGAGQVDIQSPAYAGSHRVEDSREGWIRLIRQLLESYTGSGTAPAVVDYSEIRPPGSPIRGFGGVSSGPGPLKQLVSDIRSILGPLEGKPITVTAIVDLCNAIGRCVVSGNVRRSAEIALGPNTPEFRGLKSEEQQKKRPWFWCSNNSVVDPHSFEDIANSIKVNGEPGIFFLSTAQAYGRLKDEANDDDYRASGTNPCSEQTLESRELCCLVETFPSLHDSLEDYLRTLKFAYLYAKTVTTIPTHDPYTNAVMLRNRRIGCSMTGVTEALAKFGARQFFQGYCDKGYDYLEDLDDIYSDWLCIPRSIKITSVKPSGTVSKLPGVAEGIHFPPSEYYYQVIRFASDSPYLKPLAEAGYATYRVEGETNTTAVYFPCKVHHFTKGRAEATLWEQMEIAAQMQYWWADNQVSFTATFKKEEMGDIQNAIDMYSSRLKSLSMMPLVDHGYNHAPQQPMEKSEYDRVVAQLKPLNLESRNEVIDDLCDGTECEIPNYEA